jgi:hypothetical protein
MDVWDNISSTSLYLTFSMEDLSNITTTGSVDDTNSITLLNIIEGMRNIRPFIFSPLGIVMNIFTVIILSKKGAMFDVTMSIYLRVLAIMQTLYLLYDFPIGYPTNLFPFETEPTWLLPLCIFRQICM